jgi:hypothetical protein
MDSSQEFLTPAETADLLRISIKSVRRQIDATRHGLPGGWPTDCWINVTPSSERAVIRIHKTALLQYLQANASR